MTRSKGYTVLGIDPGTQVTGYALLELRGGERVPLDFGCIRPPQKVSLPKKYVVIHECIEELVERFRVDAVAIETQFVSRNPQSAIKLGMARAAAILPGAKRGIEIYEYAPTKVKSAVVGVGHASKEQMQGMLKMLLKLEKLPTPEDAADALGIAYCHLNHIVTRN